MRAQQHRNHMNASAQHLQHQQQQQPRIQGSKSVPTLVDPNQPSPQMNGAVPPPPSVLQSRERRPTDMSGGGPYPQTYNSMPKSGAEGFGAGQPMNNSRNYASHQMLGNYNTIANYSPSRPDSQLSFHSQQRMSSSQSQQLYPEERHYQNIQLYQIQPKPSPNSVPQRPPVHSSHSSLQTDGQLYNPQQNSRPHSALIANRDADQYMGPMGANSPGTPTSPRPPLGMNPNMMGPPGDQFHYPPQQYSNAPMPQRQASQDYDSQNMMDYPSRNYPPPHPPYGDPRHRDIMRQEAKMDEMREEVKRREERERMQSGGGPQMNSLMRGTPTNGQWAAHRPPYYPPGQQMPMNGGSRLQMPPPPQPAPKPKPTAAQMLSNYGQNNSYSRNSYREAHPPHDAIPQHQQQAVPQPPPNVSYRYGPSGYPPSRQSEPSLRSPTVGSQKTPFTDALNNITNSRVINNTDLRKNHSGVVSPSPWEREEKERVMNFCAILYTLILEI